MNLSDLNVLSGTPLVRASVNTATVNGPAFDLQQFLNNVKVSVHVGAVTGTTPTLDGKIQDSADGAAFADVVGLTFPTVTASNVDQSLGVDTRQVRRFIRYVGTIGGTTPSFTFNVGALGYKKTI